MPNFLVSSAGRRGHLVRILAEVARSAGGGTVVAADASPLSSAGLLADKFEIVPLVSDAGFVPAVLDVCERHCITHVVPTIDPELPVYAEAREAFASRGITVWISSPATAALGADKWLFHQWLVEHDFDTSRTVELRDSQVLQGAVMAKPRHGSASIGLHRFATSSDAAAAALTDDYILQEVVPGYEVTVDFAVDDTGRLLGIGARRRLEVRAGEVAKALTIDHPRLTGEIERLATSLEGAFGALNVQVFVDDDADRVRFIELNPRFGGGFPLSWQAGARLPASLLQPGAPRADARPGLVMLRYDDAVFAEAAAFGDAFG